MSEDDKQSDRTSATRWDTENTVVVRLGRRQTPYRYNVVETIERDLAAANIRAAQLKADWMKAATDAGKMAEAASRLRQKHAALAEKQRAKAAAKRAGTTSPADDSGG